MKVIGIDLSGPANHKDTSIAVFKASSNTLLFESLVTKASDEFC